MTTIPQVKAAVCKRFNIDMATLVGSRGVPEIAISRQIAYLACRDVGKSLPHIGKSFHRDHSTVLFGIRAARKRIETDPVWAGHYACIKAMLS